MRCNADCGYCLTSSLLPSILQFTFSAGLILSDRNLPSCFKTNRIVLQLFPQPVLSLSYLYSLTDTNVSYHSYIVN